MRTPRMPLVAVLLVAGCDAAVPLDDSLWSDGGLPVGTDDGGASGLPCYVAMVLQNHCLTCHGHPPSGGATVSISRYEDLVAQSPAYPGQTLAQRALTRMQDTQTPMPPSPAPSVSAPEIATFQAWVQAGTPRGTCGTVDPFSAPPQCTSMVTWNGGNEGSSRMHPGDACIACHDQSGGEAPYFSIAGTVYQTAHEPSDCYGNVSGGGITVEITDANGYVLNLYPNVAGNFSSRANVATPYGARVLYQGKSRDMVMHQTSGDCNACHTQNGANGAPGRIIVP